MPKSKTQQLRVTRKSRRRTTGQSVGFLFPVNYEVTSD